MAYKTLSTLLPVDIVNGIMEYNGYKNDNDVAIFHLYKIYNVLKISHMGTYMNLLIIEPKSKHTHHWWKSYYLGEIRKIKKYSYAEMHVEYMTAWHLIKIQIVISTVPRNISYSISAYAYIHKYGIKCINCIRYPSFCINCDFSRCKDSEILVYACK